MSAMRRDKRRWAQIRAGLRERMITENGLPCWRCGELIRPGEPWDVGHVRDRALGGSDADGLAAEHRFCNRSAGGKLSHQLSQGFWVTRRRPGELFGVSQPYDPNDPRPW